MVERTRFSTATDICFGSAGSARAASGGGGFAFEAVENDLPVLWHSLTGVFRKGLVWGGGSAAGGPLQTSSY